MKNLKPLLWYLLGFLLACSSTFSDPAEDEKNQDKGKKSKQLFAYSFDDICDHLVVIESENGKGSGFIAKMGDKYYIFTNQHTILGANKISFKNSAGKKLQPKKIELSTTRDIARLLLDTDVGFTLSDNIEMDAPIGVFGRSELTGAAIERYGKINGIGGELVEVSAKFNPGNSGSPVLNADKEVIGIASYSQKSARHAMKKGTRFDETTRHFCYRVGENGWKSVNWKTYNKKFGMAYRKHDTFCTKILDIFKDGESYNASAKQANSLATECRTHARQLRMLTEQRDLTNYLRNEFEEQAELLDYAYDLFSNYAKTR